MVGPPEEIASLFKSQKQVLWAAERRQSKRFKEGDHVSRESAPFLEGHWSHVTSQHHLYLL